jgi:phospholipid-binding lipoprotein MlaA
MDRIVLPLVLFLASLTMGIAHSLAEEVKDPFEGFNRTVHRFNMVLDDYIARPTAVIYTTLVPSPVEKGIANVFSNLDEISNVANDVLQGKFAQAGNDSGRFVINATLGIGGLFEVAESLGLPKSEGEDFSQTLAKWGVPDGPFLMLPLVGPATLRDVPSRFIDSQASPISQIDDVSERNSLRVLSLVSTRAELLEFDDVIAGDSYIFLRDIYLQRKDYLESDGVIEDDFGDLDDY